MMQELVERTFANPLMPQPEPQEFWMRKSFEPVPLTFHPTIATEWSTDPPQELVITPEEY